LESGDALDPGFREIEADTIERFRREIMERTGDRAAADKLTDADLLREVMNTVGKPGKLGEGIRFVVSVAMLTEGWDANTVTHVLGVRAFGTQLLCEPVVGRALRRQSDTLNAENQFDVEYADVLGIPFDFAAKPVVVPPEPPVKTTRVQAINPERDGLEIRFPRVDGYRVEMPAERLQATFSANSDLTLTPELVGPSTTQNLGIVGVGREPDGAAPGRHARQHDRLPPGPPSAVPQVPRPGPEPEAASEGDALPLPVAGVADPVVAYRRRAATRRRRAVVMLALHGCGASRETSKCYDVLTSSGDAHVQH